MQDGPVEAYDLAHRTLSLYWGHFLLNETAYSWANAYRDKLRSRFLRVIERIGDHLEAEGRFVDAEEIYQWALQLDPIVEATIGG